MRFWLHRLYDEIDDGGPGGEVTPIPVVVTETDPESSEELDDIVTLAVLIDEKQDGILEGQEACLQRLDQLLTAETAENPVLSQISASIQAQQTATAEISSRLQAITSILERMQSRSLREPSGLTPETPEPETHVTQRTGESTEGRAPVEPSVAPPPERPKRRTVKF